MGRGLEIFQKRRNRRGDFPEHEIYTWFRESKASTNLIFCVWSATVLQRGEVTYFPAPEAKQSEQRHDGFSQSLAVRNTRRARSSIILVLLYSVSLAAKARVWCPGRYRRFVSTEYFRLLSRRRVGRERYPVRVGWPCAMVARLPQPLLVIYATHRPGSAPLSAPLSH